jgi:ribosome-binding factor A
MKPSSKPRRDAGPSQRQLRAGEVVRHALTAVLLTERLNDGALEGVSVTVTEVRMSPDLRHAQVYVEPLGGVHVRAVIEGLNRAAKFIRGRLGRHIELKFTPDLRFVHDESFEEADRMERLIAGVRREDEARRMEDADEEAPAGSVRVFSNDSGGGSPPPQPSPIEGEGEG